jgi:hypothetical protein
MSDVLALCKGSFVLLIVWIVLELFWRWMRRGMAQCENRPLQPENGKMVGYKMLHWNEVVGCWESAFWRGPMGYWIGTHITADQEPQVSNTSGIYVCKYYSDPFLHFFGEWGGTKIFVVSMDEPIVEHERGYRAAGATILREVK